MHLYADENFPYPVVEELRRFGHDATILGNIGPDAKAAIPDLNLVAENDQYATVKQAARNRAAENSDEAIRAACSRRGI